MTVFHTDLLRKQKRWLFTHADFTQAIAAKAGEDCLWRGQPGIFTQETQTTGWDMALFHCMVRHGTVRYGSLLRGFPLGTVPGTWYFFSTTSAEVPSNPYRYQNVTCKLCWSLIGRRESSLLRHWTCDMRPIDPLDLNQHSQRRIGRNFCLNKRTFLYQPQHFVSTTNRVYDDVTAVEAAQL